MSTTNRQARRNLLKVGLSLAGLGLLPAIARADGKERHPHIRAAIRELREAKKELKEADHDFGGHRVDAIKAIDVAIEQLETCLKFDKK